MPTNLSILSKGKTEEFIKNRRLKDDVSVYTSSWSNACEDATVLAAAQGNSPSYDPSAGKWSLASNDELVSFDDNTISELASVIPFAAKKYESVGGDYETFTLTSTRTMTQTADSSLVVAPTNGKSDGKVLKVGPDGSTLHWEDDNAPSTYLKSVTTTFDGVLKINPVENGKETTIVIDARDVGAQPVLGPINAGEGISITYPDAKACYRSVGSRYTLYTREVVSGTITEMPAYWDESCSTYSGGSIHFWNGSTWFFNGSPTTYPAVRMSYSPTVKISNALYDSEGISISNNFQWDTTDCGTVYTKSVPSTVGDSVAAYEDVLCTKVRTDIDSIMLTEEGYALYKDGTVVSGTAPPIKSHAVKLSSATKTSIDTSDKMTSYMKSASSLTGESTVEDVMNFINGMKNSVES